MIKLVGYQQKKGTFTNEKTGEVIEYDNYELYCMTDEDEKVKGLMTVTHKIKAEELVIKGAKDLDELINKEIDLVMNGKGNKISKIYLA